MATDTNKNSVVKVGSGVVIGLLLSGGAFFGLKDRLTPAPVVRTVEVVKVVEKIVKVHVERKTTVTKNKLFRAQLVDKDGKVIKEWIVTKCKFRVVGATLTDTNGKTFPVTGGIRIAPLAKGPQVAEEQNVASVDDDLLLVD